MHYFWKKAIKIAVQLWGLRPPQAPVAIQRLGFAPDPVFLLLFAVTTFNSSVIALKHIVVEKEQNVLISHFKLGSFCWRERKNIILPWAQGTLATPLSACCSASAPKFLLASGSWDLPPQDLQHLTVKC